MGDVYGFLMLRLALQEDCQIIEGGVVVLDIGFGVGGLPGEVGVVGSPQEKPDKFSKIALDELLFPITDDLG